MKTTCIVGAGITGLLLILLLQEAGADLSKITIIDPFFDGGDLSRKWTAVLSNTPWSKTVDSLKRCCPSLSFTSPHDPSTCTPLIEIAHLIRSIAAPLLKKLTQIQGTVLSTSYSTETKEWAIDLGGTTIRAQQIILAPGGDPKTLNLAIPSIPLDVALDPQRLKHYVKSTDSVIVFGTMHSGTLVIRNLAALTSSVTAYYQSPEPFYWDRNGDYDGIKGEAATIADDIMANVIPVTLVPIKDTAAVIRTSRDSQWVVYAMGFTPRKVNLLVDGVERSATGYTESTGKLNELPAWGFGVAYPNRAPDGVHWDVGVAPFLDHMKTQIPDILQ
jgi:cation diffusion facilitator CzcD-associated flavoprotein CzcO